MNNSCQKNLLKTGLYGLFFFVSHLISINVFAQIGVNNQTDPRALYELMRESHKNYDFQGVFVYEQGGRIRTFDIDSKYGDSSFSQSLSVLDGSVQQHQMSFNSDCVNKMESITARSNPQYNFHVRGEARVAGIEGVEIVLSPIDKYRYGYQYIIEPESGILLRSITLTPERRVLERIQFTQIEYQPAKNLNASKQLVDDVIDEAVEVTQPDDSNAFSNTESDNPILNPTSFDSPILESKTDSLVTLDEQEYKEEEYKKVSCNSLNIDNGWFASWLPEGFSIISSGFDGERATLVYTDGIATMSVFVEDVLESFLPPSTAHRGATTIHLNYLSDQTSSYLVSIVGEVPAATAQRVLSSLRRK